MGKTQTSKKKNDESTSPGCICPEGCVVKKPIDQKNPPEDAVLMSCSNDCGTNRFVHAECMVKWEEKLIKIMSSTSGRGARWTDTQRRANLWNKKGYECTMHLCRCPCTGFLRREETIDVAAIVPHEPKPKSKTKHQALPKLETQASTNPMKNKALVASRFVESSVYPNAARPRRSLTPEDDEWEKPAPKALDGARFMFAFDDIEESEPHESYRPPPPDSPMQFPSLPMAQPATEQEAWGTSVPKTTAWTVQTDSLLSTPEQLSSALHSLIVKKGGPVTATDVSLLELVQNRLSLSMQSALSDCGGLLTWIRRQRTDDLCAISDKIMTGRMAREHGYIACSSVQSQSSSRSRTASGTQSKIVSSPPYFAPVCSPRPSVAPQIVASPLPAKVVPSHSVLAPPMAPYDISAHLALDTEIAYDTVYAIEGLKLYQIACKTMLNK